MRPVDQLFERATLAIARRLVPQGWRGHDKAPDNLSDLVAAWDNCKRIGGPVIVSDLHCERTVFSSPDVNMAFRAWHDYRHITTSAEFDHEGEYLVHEAMMLDLYHWFGGKPAPVGAYSRTMALLDCENIGQLEYWKVYGSPPDDQRTFALGYLASRSLLKEGN
jgi:hypothetical protein